MQQDSPSIAAVGTECSAHTELEVVKRKAQTHQDSPRSTDVGTECSAHTKLEVVKRKAHNASGQSKQCCCWYGMFSPYRTRSRKKESS